MTEKLAADNENAFRAIYEACEEGIVVVDLEGKIKMANQAAHQIFEFESGKMRGRIIEDLIPATLRHTHKKDRATYNKKPEPRRMGAGRELLALRQSGDEFPVEISLNVAQLNGEKHVIAYVIDISERKKIEAALKKSEEQLILYASQLEKRVKERTEELELQVKETKRAEKEAQLALEKEKELNELKSRFVSMASHEFRTPLSTILSSSSLIGKYNEQEGARAKREKHISKIKSAIDNLNGILDDFLSISKLEEGKLDVDIRNIDLVDICQEVVEEISSIKKENQEIDLTIKGKALPIKADPKIIKNILINLASNAIKYSEESIEIGLDFKRTNDICICVIDKGMGIPDEDQKHLFERFFRAKNATNIQGTGLGLNIVKKYIEMLGGGIKFKSKLNEGSEFHVTLPKTKD